MNTTVANNLTNRWKKMVYKYDLISGKVNEVAYQPGLKDAYYHRYSYDSENRLTDVETSTDRVIWEKDARYSYYKHGPLARAIIGQQQVQGIDYAYTIQGWLKGVNSSSVADGTFDMGGDGIASSPTPIQVARDAYGFSLNYFNGDYKKIGTGADAFVNTAFNLTNADNNVVAKPLYNGNIAAMFVNIPKLGNAQLYGYKYDQLNRIKSMDSFKGFTNSSNTFTGNNPTASADYKERASYDANGNIISYVRNGNTARNSMDDMAYTYKPGTNKLDKVVDAATDATTDYALYNDIKQGQQNANYEYDLIGNLVRDKSADLFDPNDTQKKMIEWNVYGKISKITKITAGQTTTILYTYDAGGNRITKTVNGKTTWYVRDASGNVMSTYESGGVNGGALTQTELHMYGSSRLGINNVNNNMSNAGTTPLFVRGNKLYEITNHLSNVLGTVSDKKIQHSTNGTTVDWYEPDVVTANDYYPGGMTQPGRKFVQVSSSYKYGFNGKELDNSTGEGNLDFGARIYDGRIGRWLSVDPLQLKYTDLSPYQFCANSPISAKDPDGRLIIFINGLWGWPNQVGKGGTIDYWGESWVSKVQSRMGDTKPPLFYDGSIGGTSRIFSSPFRNNANTLQNRINAGERAGYDNAAAIIGGLDKGETIKFVTNSMGAAFERGFTKGILKYQAEENAIRTTFNADIDIKILLLSVQKYNIENNVGNPLEPQKPLSKTEISTAINNLNTKIADLRASKKELLNVVLESNTDLSYHEINYPDPNVKKSYYMTVAPKNMNLGELAFVNQKAIKGAINLGDMTSHHSSGADPEKLPESKKSDK